MSRTLSLLNQIITPEAQELARQEEMKGADPVAFLLKENLVTPKTLLAFLSKHYMIPYIELDRYHPSEEAVASISEEIARQFTVMPLFLLEGRIYLAMSNPEALDVLDNLRHITGKVVEPVLATISDIEAAINLHYLTQERTARAMKTFSDDQMDQQAAPAESEVVLEDEEVPVIKLINYIFPQAIILGASDLPLEAFHDRIMLRYRVDGVLHEFPPPPVHLYRSLISRIKIISNLDLAEKRLPQDGRASFQVHDREYDLRVSIIPNLNGEGAVIRILDLHGMLKLF